MLEQRKQEKTIANPAVDDIASVDNGETGSLRVTADTTTDQAAHFLNLHKGTYGGYSVQDANKVRRKIDWRLLPLMWITTNLSAIDKIIISNAALYGMTTDLDLSGQRYSWVGSIFYFGFLLGEWPFGPVMQRLPLAKLLAGTVMAWGGLTLLMSVTRDAAGLMTLRFLMGFFEAPLYPMLSIMTVMWYRREEQPVRVTVWFTSLSSVITGVVSYGIGHAVTGIASWRLLFIALGGFTFIWGIVLVVFLPDSPVDCKFLDERERFIAIDRIKENMTGVHNKKFKWYQVREAFIDWKSWCICAISILLNVPNGGLVTFAAQIVSGLGYGPLETTLLGMPTGVFQTLSAFLVSGLSYYTTNMRTTWGALCCLVPLACSILIRKLPDSNQIGLLVAYYFFYFFWGAYPTIISLPISNTSGHTKKLTVNAMTFTSYCLANIIAPQLFRADQAPQYTTGYNAMTGCEIGAICCILLYMVGCRLENARRDRLHGKIPPATDGNVDMTSTNDLMDDLTDWEKPNFRYVY